MNFDAPEERPCGNNVRKEENPGYQHFILLLQYFLLSQEQIQSFEKHCNGFLFVIIYSLHEEVMAQRALDRRLTEELMRFKSTISILTR